jgi:hypothetical protein
MGSLELPNRCLSICSKAAIGAARIEASSRQHRLNTADFLTIVAMMVDLN